MEENQVPYARVYVRELNFDETQKTCSVSGKTVSKIELLGTVVYRSIRENVYILSIDDGTGAVQCVKFPSEDDPFPHCKVKRVPLEIQELYQASVTASSFIPDLGDCLHIRGRPSYFRGQPQIIINQLRVVQDCNEWWFRVLELKASRDAKATSAKN